jgi:hypothetical protein
LGSKGNGRAASVWRVDCATTTGSAPVTRFAATVIAPHWADHCNQTVATVAAKAHPSEVAVIAMPRASVPFRVCPGKSTSDKCKKPTALKPWTAAAHETAGFHRICRGRCVDRRITRVRTTATCPRRRLFEYGLARTCRASACGVPRRPGRSGLRGRPHWQSSIVGRGAVGRAWQPA